ncbi:hypothetical protein [Pseudomonas sp. CCC2.2]|uniref:hypothetical protein n=1 Tax=Pseudomonas sp. CCC2.2 TaxID=3048605 RepID=UPI002B231B23|nr:hypothetical protein [Pseudomonas sp. CCC2.2]MEB0149051.1 hypothetical protein [Pseudomonas sp. CCC2.2]
MNTQTHDQLRQQERLDQLRSYITKNCHRYSPEQISEELMMPLFLVQQCWPNPNR